MLILLPQVRHVLSKIFVYVWFDVEDYITKESNDLPPIAFRILKKYNVPVTCKLVAEKVRFLQENGRNDVLEAIAEYDVGYHLDTHSRHPTLYEYLADLDTRAGAKEFYSREKQGFELVKQVFSRNPSCFGHPGPAWAPHVYPALTEMGIPIYLDETPIMNLNNQPYWYCGVLNLNGANHNFIVFDYTFENPNGVAVLKRKFKKMHDTLNKSDGGAVSILFHLHTTINKKFWDAVNFGKGKNRNREEYTRPSVQPAKITSRAWEQFEELIKFMSSFDDVEFITATQAAKIYSQPTKTVLTKDDLRRIVKHLRKSTDYLEAKYVLSPAQVFYAVARSLGELVNGPDLPEKVEFKEPLGPLVSTRTTGDSRVFSKDLVAAARSAVEFIDQEKCLPPSIRVGESADLSPEDFLVTASKLLGIILANKPLPKKMIVSQGAAPNVKYVNPAAFKKACKWPVLPAGFKAPKILEQIKLQAWTLRPAYPVSN
jgi:hypothetical protein